MPQPTLAERVKIILDRKMTQKEFAERINVTENTVVNWFKGKASPIKSFEKICEVLGVEVVLHEKVEPTKAKFRVLGEVLFHTETPMFLLRFEKNEKSEWIIKSTINLTSEPIQLIEESLLEEATKFFLGQ